MKITLDQIEPNNWNANEVKGEKYTQLVKDLQEQGQREPVTVSPYNTFYEVDDTPENRYVICDGEHRYSAAKSLGWKEIEANVLELTEDEALTRYYRQQSTRGDHNPLKEAELFEYYHEDHDLTEEEIAEKFNVTRSYVSGRRMLLNTTENVRELFLDPTETLVEMGAPVARLSAGHVKALIGLDPEEQDKMAMDALIHRWSVRDTEEKAREYKEHKEKRKRFVELLSQCKIPACPECGQTPTAENWNIEGKEFSCANPDCRTISWRYDKTEEELREEEKKEDYELIDQILETSAGPIALEALQHLFYQQSRYARKGESNSVIDGYLADHPETELREPEKIEPEITGASKNQFDEELNHALNMPPVPTENDYQAAGDPDHRDVFAPRGAEPDIEETRESEPIYRFTTTDAEPEDLHEAIRYWIQTKLEDIVHIKDIELRGLNGEGEEVLLQFTPKHRFNDEGVLRYTVKQGPVEQKFWITIASQKYQDKTMVSPWNTSDEETLPMKKQLIKRFFEEIYDTDLDPWDTIEELGADPEEIKQAEDEGGFREPPAPIYPIPDHDRDHQTICMKCGEPASETRNIDEYGICDECAGRIHQEDPEWCGWFRNADTSQPYCVAPELKETDRCIECPMYLENMKAEQEQDDVPRGSKNMSGTLLCASCGKQVPETRYCISCGEELLPAEPEEKPELTDNIRKWLDTPIKDLEPDDLDPGEAEKLLELETRKGALGLLEKHRENPDLAEPVQGGDTD